MRGPLALRELQRSPPEAIGHHAHHLVDRAIKFADQHVALPHASNQRVIEVRRRLHFLPIADFLTGHAVDGCSYAVKDDDRALCVLQDRLIFLVELFAGVKVEIFARLAAPIDLALAVIIGLNEPFQLGKERVSVLLRVRSPQRRHCRRPDSCPLRSAFKPIPVDQDRF